MASYSIINNAVFQPFTYQELALPLMQMQQKQEALEEEYDKLSAQADVLEAMGRNDRDIASGAYAKYKAFSDELRARADALYENGLDYDSRVRLHEMKRMYNTDIVPIQNAWQKREEEIKLQRDAYLKNPSLMFSRDAASTSLDEYLANPTGGFKVYDKNAITKEAAAVFSSLANKIKGGYKVDVDDFTYKYISEYGLTPDMIDSWLANPDSNKSLTRMMNNVLKSHGITVEDLKDTPNGENILRQGAEAAAEGVWAAVGKDQAEKMDNFENQERYKAYLKGAGSGEGSVSGGDVDLISFGTGVEKEANYSANLMDRVNELTRGDRLNSSYFGVSGVNPMKLYDMLQEELKKPGYYDYKYNQTAPGVQGTYTKTLKDGARKKAVDKVLSEAKDRGYNLKELGVKDILSDEQYNAMRQLGYSSESDFSDMNSAGIMNKANNTARLRTGYYTSMRTDNAYDNMDTYFRTQVRLKDEKGSLGSEVYVKKSNGRLEGYDDADDILLSDDGKEKLKIKMIGYDPTQPGFVKVVVSDDKGKKVKELFVKPEMLNGSDLRNYLNRQERSGYDADMIAEGFVKFLNRGNVSPSNTSSKEAIQ